MCITIPNHSIEAGESLEELVFIDDDLSVIFEDQGDSEDKMWISPKVASLEMSSSPIESYHSSKNAGELLVCSYCIVPLLKDYPCNAQELLVSGPLWQTERANQNFILQVQIPETSKLSSITTRLIS